MGVIIVISADAFILLKPSVTSFFGPAYTVCTQEAKQCPDGSYVNRTGKNCEFAKCPAINPPLVAECKKDSDCPSQQYICQAIQGMATICQSNDKSCEPTYSIIKGECKLKEGSQCVINSDCAAGNLCYTNICIRPIGKQCSGPSDASCPADFDCIQGCGPPVAREDELPPPYYCQLKGYVRQCPICLDGNTLIDTPSGTVIVKDLQVGMPIWTIDTVGHRILGTVVKTSKAPVSPKHQIVHIIFDDGRELYVSPGHPTIDGRTFGDLIVNDLYNNARVIASELVAYDGEATYDVLPSGETGFYWANGILIDSTLR